MKKNIILLLFLSLLVFSKPICGMLDGNKGQKKKLLYLQKSSLEAEQEKLTQITEKISLEKEGIKNSWNNLKSGGFCDEPSKIFCHAFTLYVKLYPKQEYLKEKIELRQKNIERCHH